MRGSVVWHLILKDLRLHRMQVLITIAGAIVALAVVQIRSEVPAVIGAIWFFIALILLASMLPSSNVINERKKQTRAFLMSLPISGRQYATAKIASTFGMFLAPWLALVAAAVLLIETRTGFPHGMIPLTIVLAGLTLVGFCVSASTAIISESEGWYIASTVVCNSSYGIVWYLISRIPAVQHETGGPVAVWSSTMLEFLGAEFAIVALCFGLTLFLQSRKRDFI